jgi:fumarate reductase flavoprotein subunit
MPSPTIETITTDLLILGSGGAGLFAALHAYDANPRTSILITVKGLVGKSGCTRMVQGGYNAVLHPSDSLEQHFRDTIEGGAYLNDQELAWTLINTAPERIRELENRMGCFFDRNPDGTILQKAFAGRSFDRTMHRGDLLTGIEIMTRLMEQVFRHNIPTLEDHRAIDLLPTPEQSGVAGALFVDTRRGTFLVVRAKATLLATGAGPTVYKIMAPSAEKTTDGLALAYRVGARLMDMEMVQFHPTGLLVGELWHERHGAGGGAPRCGRLSVQWPARTLHGARPPHSPGALYMRHRVPELVSRNHGWPRQLTRWGLHRRVTPRRPLH